MVDHESQLIEASLRGEIEAFNQLVRLYEGRVYTLCFRMLGDRDSAADAAQETFLSAYNKLHTFRGGVFRAWIMRIATNACYDMLRARKRRPSVSLDATFDPDAEHPAINPPDPGEAPDDTVLRHELAAAIQAGLATLPEDQRLVLILSDIQGMAYDEIAVITNTNLGTIKSRLSRGRARLRDYLRAGELLPARYRHET